MRGVGGVENAVFLHRDFHPIRTFAQFAFLQVQQQRGYRENENPRLSSVSKAIASCRVYLNVVDENLLEPLQVAAVASQTVRSMVVQHGHFRIRHLLSGYNPHVGNFHDPARKGFGVETRAVYAASVILAELLANAVVSIALFAVVDYPVSAITLSPSA